MYLAAMRLCAVMAAYGALVTFDMHDSRSRTGSAIAVVMALGVIWWCWEAYRGRVARQVPLPIIALTVAIPVILPQIGVVGCERLGPNWWGSVAA